MTFLLDLLCFLLWLSNNFTPISSFAFEPTLHRHHRPPSVLATIKYHGTYYRYLDRHHSSLVLFYRDRERHEEQLLETSTNVMPHWRNPNPTPNPKKGEQNSRRSDSGIRWEVLLPMANFHAAVIAISIIAATSIGYPSLIAGPNWGFGTSSFLSSMVLGCLAAVPLIGTHHVLESSITPSCRAFHWTRIRTTDALFHTLGTRRNHKRQQPSEQHHKQTETHVVILVLTALGILTSTAEECVFRILLPSLLVATAAPSILALDTTTTTTILSILISAVVYGMFHFESSARASENCGTITGQCGMALYQSLLLSLTGTIVPCIVSHLLYELHVHVETWHTANTQLDYIQEQQQKQQMYDDNDSFGSIMQTFFYGFDREQVGTLSESDVQRAVSFAFRNEIVVPSMNEVRQHMKQFHSTRFNLPDFVNLLSDLYAKYGRKTS